MVVVWGAAKVMAADKGEFDKAIAEFARAYADQTEQDWRALLNAIAIGRIAAEPHAAGQPP